MCPCFSFCLSTARGKPLVLFRGGKTEYLAIALNPITPSADRVCGRHEVFRQPNRPEGSGGWQAGTDSERMRLHLDTSGAAGSAEAGSAASSLSAAEKTAAVPNSPGTGTSPALDSGPRDSVAVSGASSAWSASFSDRATRVGQLSALVQNGTYRVASAAVSQSIVASALA